MPKMIFHVPYPLNREATSASGIRPVAMRDAFESLGYEVTEVTGLAAQRKAAIRSVRKRIRSGEKFDFVYSESSTMPTALTEPHHLPTHPLQDISFLGYCKRRGIPSGVFYRDIYWQEPAYRESVNALVALGTRRLYRWDLRRYRTQVSRIFVPSMRMAEVMPHTRLEQCVPLPPGSPIVDQPVADNPSALCYVGALGSYYRLHECVRAVESVPGASLQLCTRPQLWEAEKAGYVPLMLNGATTVIHESGAGLEPMYKSSAVGVLFMEPIDYREFAAPMKLYEYLGHGLPVVAVKGSLVAEFIEEYDAGWALDYDGGELSELLRRLQSNPDEYAQKAERVRNLRRQHTWEARAQQAADALSAAR
ncbi:MULTISPECIES: glycosyltransferase [unclassified Leucobacter]|uniref:glycosyltransferase family protein n=1 Tax=unclassified Leucobacter TaxID=2621730 RepID=UPI00165E3287|nr:MULTISPECIES: glycosyltransferase [unclassified Leucobacter]MBC9936607.1 glycosyltransferase [Leucobacter sp. cx-87]